MARQCFGKRTSLILMLCLMISFFFIEIVAGYAMHSLELKTDSFRMISGIVSLFIGYFALEASKKFRRFKLRSFSNCSHCHC